MLVNCQNPANPSGFLFTCVSLLSWARPRSPPRSCSVTAADNSQSARSWRPDLARISPWTAGEPGSPNNMPAASLFPLRLTILLSAIKGNHFLLIFAEIEKRHDGAPECRQRGISAQPKLTRSPTNSFICKTFSSQGTTKAASRIEHLRINCPELGFSVQRKGLVCSYSLFSISYLPTCPHTEELPGT